MVSTMADPPAVDLKTSVIGFCPSGAPTATQVPVRAETASKAEFFAGALSFGCSAAKAAVRARQIEQAKIALLENLIFWAPLKYLSHKSWTDLYKVAREGHGQTVDFDLDRMVFRCRGDGRG